MNQPPRPDESNRETGQKNRAPEGEPEDGECQQRQEESVSLQHLFPPGLGGILWSAPVAACRVPVAV